MEFEWDAAKERENIRKHQIDFLEAVDSFLDPHGFQLSMKNIQAQKSDYIGLGKVLLDES